MLGVLSFSAGGGLHGVYECLGFGIRIMRSGDDLILTGALKQRLSRVIDLCWRVQAQQLNSPFRSAGGRSQLSSGQSARLPQRLDLFPR